MTETNSTLLTAAPFTSHTAYTLWRLDPNPAGADRKPVKVPIWYDAKKNHSKADPAPPLSAELASLWLADHHASNPASAAPGQVGYIGVGFRPEGTGLVCIDLDNCAFGDAWTPGAQALMARFPGALVERSTSGTGAHIWVSVRGTGPGRNGKKTTPMGEIEVYSEGQFIACGEIQRGDASTDHTEAVAALMAEFWPPAAPRTGEITAPDWASKTPEQQAATLRDLRSAIARLDPDDRQGWVDAGFALNGLGDEGYAIWAEWSATSSRFPGGDGLDRFYTLEGNQTDYRAIFAKAERAGWTNPARRADPLQTFAVAAVELPVGALTERPAPVALVTQGGLALRTEAWASLGDQERMFQGCTYVANAHRVLMPNGSMLKPEAFNAMKGGYTFALSMDGEAKTKKAFEALTENQVLPFPRVEATNFKPELPFGAITEYEGQTLVNIYRPLGVEPVAGDASPWLRLIEKQYPEKRDRDILVAYLAACLRYPGRKFQWAIVLQGVQGSAKTLHARVLQAGLGARYVHELNPKKLDNQFNAFLRNRLLITIEEIYIPGNRHDLIDTLKPLITNNRLEVEAKGVDAGTEDICANFLLSTNHPDGVPASRAERRFAMLQMAQQEPEDLNRDGLTSDYFHQLYLWLDAGGYAVVVHHLLHCDVAAQYDPAGACVRAPETSSTERAIQQSMGREEQFIHEAIEADEPGFAGGWLSSRKAGLLLKDKLGREPSPRLLGTIIKRLGYRHHSALNGGRTDSAVMPDNSKTTLYVKPGSPADYGTLDLSRVDVTKAYSAAQPAIGFGFGTPDTDKLHNLKKPTLQ